MFSLEDYKDYGAVPTFTQKCCQAKILPNLKIVRSEFTDNVSLRDRD